MVGGGASCRELALRVTVAIYASFGTASYRAHWARGLEIWALTVYPRCDNILFAPGENYPMQAAYTLVATGAPGAVAERDETPRRRGGT